MRADRASYLADLCALLRVKWPENRTVNVVCHGHSVPGGYWATPIVDPFRSYPHLLHRRLHRAFPFACVNVIVTAKGGEDSEGGAERFERDVLPLRPDLLTIDYAWNDRGIGHGRARAAWSSMIRRAATQGTKVVLLTPTSDFRSRPDDPLDELSGWAELIRELAAEHGVGLADSLAVFHAHLRAGARAEDLLAHHLTAHGHRLVADELFRWFPPALWI
jgi:hypothetical protein